MKILLDVEKVALGHTSKAILGMLGCFVRLWLTNSPVVIWFAVFAATRLPTRVPVPRAG